MVNNSININKTKESLNSDGHQFHQYQQNKRMSKQLNISTFGDFVDRIYPIELEIKDTTDTDRSASYLDLHI
jgi:hypothetical protein